MGDTPGPCALFLCTADHLLTLICTWTKRNHGGRYGVSSGYTPGKILTFRCASISNGVTSGSERTGYLKSPRPGIRLSLGWTHISTGLGWGTECVRCELTSPPGEMVSEWIRYWRGLGFRVVESKPISWSVRSQKPGESIWPTEWVQESAVGGHKRIRPEYFRGSIDQRMSLLAGLIDSDGTPRGAGYGIVTKWGGLADDIETVARSLGFLVSRKKKEARDQEYGVLCGVRAPYFAGAVRTNSHQGEADPEESA